MYNLINKRHTKNKEKRYNTLVLLEGPTKHIAERIRTKYYEAIEAEFISTERLCKDALDSIREHNISDTPVVKHLASKGANVVLSILVRSQNKISELNVFLDNKDQADWWIENKKTLEGIKKDLVKILWTELFDK